MVVCMYKMYGMPFVDIRNHRCTGQYFFGGRGSFSPKKTSIEVRKTENKARFSGGSQPQAGYGTKIEFGAFKPKNLASDDCK